MIFGEKAQTCLSVQQADFETIDYLKSVRFIKSAVGVTRMMFPGSTSMSLLLGSSANTEVK